MPEPKRALPRADDALGCALDGVGGGDKLEVLARGPGDRVEHRQVGVGLDPSQGVVVGAPGLAGAGNGIDAVPAARLDEPAE